MSGPKLALADLPNWPRLLSAEQAAAYVGVSVNTFMGRVGHRLARADPLRPAHALRQGRPR